MKRTQMLLYFNLFIVLTIQIVSVEAQVDSSLLCSPEYCEELLSKEECKATSDYCEIQNATHSGINLPSMIFCNCCPYCLENILEDGYCTKGSLGSPPSNDICGPGLFCEKNGDSATCEKMQSKCEDPGSDKNPDLKCVCMQYKYDNDRENGNLGFLEQRAVCDGDGFFGPVVCIPGQTCFCQNKEGSRIFGEVINEKSISQNMKCVCSRVVNTADKLLTKDSFGGPRCLPDGSFDKLQCIGNRCFCVFAETGLLSSSTMIDFHTQSLALLPCYDKDLHPKPYEYLKPCEKKRAEILEILQSYKRQGFEYLGNPLPDCQADGNYNKIQIHETRQVCVTPEGDQIEDFGAPINSANARKMKCNCARTLHLLQSEGGIHSIPVCDSLGNWERKQCRRNYCYCVDTENGIQQGLEYDISEEDKLDC